jgi:bacterial/archaeal transporter family-2 protein
MESLLIPLALLVGGLLAVQAAANLQLSAAVGSPVGASTLQLAIGAVLLTALAGLVGTLAAVGLLPTAEPWHLLGGLGSAIYITAGILLFPRLGALVSVGLFVTGQMLASLVLDSFGLLGLGRTGLDPAAAVGALAVIAGIVIVVRVQVVPAKVPRQPVAVATARDTAAELPPAQVAAAQVRPGQVRPGQVRPGQVRGAASAAPRRGSAAPRRGSVGVTRRGVERRAGWVLLGLLAGGALPAQGAVNAQLRADLGAPVTVGAFSFATATATMGVVLLALLALRRVPRPRVAPLRDLPWWGWLGGFVGATYVVAVFLLIPEIGAAATIGLTVAGQQLASLLVDQFGLLRLPRRPLTRARLAGVALLLAGVALIQLT